MQKYTYIKGDKFGEFTLLDNKLSGRRSVKCTCGNIRQKTNTELTKVLNNELDPKCNMCNKGKHYHSVEDFTEWIERAYEWMFNDYSRNGSRPKQVEMGATLSVLYEG